MYASDLPESCVESIDLGFVRYVLGYRRSRRPRVLDALSRLTVTSSS